MTKEDGQTTPKKTKLSTDDLEEHLEEQIALLKRFAASYDEGVDIVAKPLATSLRVLLYDNPPNSNSLLGQLRLKDRLFFSSTRGIKPGEVMTFHDLVSIEFAENGPKFIPCFDDTNGPPASLDFDTWWNQPIFRIENGKLFTRKQIIRHVANQDGGAHVDPEIDSLYWSLSKGTALGWRSEKAEPIASLKRPELAAVRQIAHEILKTLDPSYQKIGKPTGTVFGGISIAPIESPAQPFIPNPTTQKKIGRNSPCHCGSGLKFKKCHGK